MRHRMVVAVLALVGLLLSVYLLLHQVGLVGQLACGSGACEQVQSSRYAWFLGLPVSAVGVGGYLAILAAALAGLQERWISRSGPTRLLVLLSLGGVLFTAYLKYVEIFRVHAICRWCVASAVVIVAILVTSVIGLRQPSA
jgi:uncharacterized membrane protein